MLTEEQEKWLGHLDNNKVEILPYNPKTKEIFEIIKKEIQVLLPASPSQGGCDTEVLHCGSTALEIVGQGEIDLYIPVSEDIFDQYLEKLTNHFGKPGSIYPLKRVRFVKYQDNIKIEIFLINKNTDDWKNLRKFENYLQKNPKALNEYAELKENSRGLSIQQYYRKKLEFINKILEQTI
jgi:GrpB-like predicted nucleotidyltransferase (UPF0157 family)